MPKSLDTSWNSLTSLDAALIMFETTWNNLKQLEKKINQAFPSNIKCDKAIFDFTEITY